MMLKRVCDRCGGIINHSVPQLMVLVLLKIKIFIDLCFECYNPFNAYVHNTDFIVVDKAFMTEVNTEEGED